MATELSDLGIGLDLCLFEDLDTDEESPHHVSATHYEIIVIGGGVRLETS